MGNFNLKWDFAGALRSLHDPQHVARFQRMCGVRGTFTGNGAANTGGAEQRMSFESGDSASLDCYRNGTVRVKAGEDAYSRHSLLPESPANGSAVGSDKEGVAFSRGPLRKNSLTGAVGQEFVIENRFLYYTFTLGTELGNELFYISFFPFLTWNVDPWVARRLIALWVWVMYLGQCTKDLLRWPRPASPPVVKMEVFYDSEYSMPSTHAMSGTAVPLGLFLLTYDRWEYPYLLGLTLALCWCSLVCVSRIYLGMHSVLDVIVGFLYSLLIVAIVVPVLEHIDTFNLSCSYSPLLVNSFHIALSVFSFTLDTWSTSRGDTAQILGTGAGIALASHLNHRLSLIIDPPASSLPLQAPPFSLGLLGLILLRFVLGVIMLIVTRAVMKALTIPLVCRASGISSQDVRKARQHVQVELPYRYIVYSTLAFSAFFLVPFLFSCIGLS